jgi:hypothetical protein
VQQTTIPRNGTAESTTISVVFEPGGDSICTTVAALGSWSRSAFKLWERVDRQFRSVHFSTARFFLLHTRPSRQLRESLESLAGNMDDRIKEDGLCAVAPNPRLHRLPLTRLVMAMMDSQ